jgi:hypothetical protein
MEVKKDRGVLGEGIASIYIALERHAMVGVCMGRFVDHLGDNTGKM